MACPDYQDRMIQLQEGSLQAGDRHALEDHLCTCDACRRFSERLHALDSAMATFGSAQGLSAGFKTGLMQRIDLEPASLSQEAIEARKRDLEAEHRTVMAGLVWTACKAHLLLLVNIAGLIAVTLIAWLALAPSRVVTVSLMVKVLTGPLVWAWAAAGVTVGLVITLGMRARRRIAGL